MKKIIGDLVNEADKFEVVAHGCNCFNTMGAGIAKFLRDKYPGVYEADTIASDAGLVEMGAVSTHYEKGIDTTFANCYTQFDYRGRYKGAMDVSYDAVRDSMKELKRNFTGKSIGLPLIGCGLAGGDWNVVEKIITEELEGEDVTLVRIVPDYLKMEIADAIKEKYDIDIPWVRIPLSLAFEDQTYDLQYAKFTNVVKMGGVEFQNFLNSTIVNFEAVQSCGCADGITMKIKIKDDYQSYCK